MVDNNGERSIRRTNGRGNEKNEIKNLKIW